MVLKMTKAGFSLIDQAIQLLKEKLLIYSVLFQTFELEISDVCFRSIFSN